MSTSHRTLHRKRFKDLGEREEGFTLIELLVVLLIIGILLAIAIPTFLSTTKSANKTSAQANLQTALTASDAYFTQSNQTFSGIDQPDTTTSDISAIDTGMSFVSGTNSTGINSISLWTDGSTSLVLAAYSAGARDCYFVIEMKAPSSTVWGGLGIGTWFSVLPNVDPGSCVAAGTTPTGAVTPQTGSYPSA